MAFHFEGVTYEGDESETVLDALLRHNIALPHSCCKGLCQVCLVRNVGIPPPAVTQIGLRDTLQHQGYFLACQCPVIDGLDIRLPRTTDVFCRAVVAKKEQLSGDVYRIELIPENAIIYHSGQFINIRREDGVTRSYSIASVADVDSAIEIHIQRRQNGLMSQWMCDQIQIGDHLDIDGPNGTCFYLPGQALQPLLLIGTGTGLSPLLGIVRDALLKGHSGPIHLYHGSRSLAGLYAREKLMALAASHSNLHIYFCVSGEAYDGDFLQGMASKHAFDQHSDLEKYRVYLCGAPEMVNSAKKTAYLQGAHIKNIYADPFENKDIRAVPRG